MGVADGERPSGSCYGMDQKRQKLDCGGRGGGADEVQSGWPALCAPLLSQLGVAHCRIELDLHSVRCASRLCFLRIGRVVDDGGQDVGWLERSMVVVGGKERNGGLDEASFYTRPPKLYPK